MLEGPWESTCGRKASLQWSREDVEKLAETWYNSFPSLAKSIVEADQFKGGLVVAIASEVIAKEHIVKNMFWVRACAEVSPDKLLSCYFIADALLLLDKKFKGRLLKPLKAAQTKTHVALLSANVIKKLGSYSRTLFRASGNSWSPSIKSLKELMRPRKKSKSESPSTTSSSQPA